MGKTDRQHLEIFFTEYGFEIEWEMQLLKRALDRKLPKRADSHDHFVGHVGDRGAGPRGQARLVGHLPYQGVPIDQQTHQQSQRSNNSSISVSVNSKSGAIHTLPL